MRSRAPLIFSLFFYCLFDWLVWTGYVVCMLFVGVLVYVDTKIFCKIGNDLMKFRRHHNNKGLQQIKRGKVKAFVKRLAKKLGIRYVSYKPGFVERNDAIYCNCGVNP